MERLRRSEIAVLNHLKEAWNEFLELEDGNHLDTLAFRDAIHVCQTTIALRVARRVDPKIWKQDA